jgi:hypothetical protein
MLAIACRGPRLPDLPGLPDHIRVPRCSPPQSVASLHLIANAGANGQTRLAGTLRQVQANLDKIIRALEALRAEVADDDPS